MTSSAFLPQAYPAWRRPPFTNTSRPFTFNSEQKQAPSLPSFQPSEILLATPKRLYNYVGPTQTFGLFMAGLVTSLGARWFIKGVSFESTISNAMKELAKQARKPEESTAVYFDKGLLSVLMFAFKNCSSQQIQQGLKAYLSATGLGYIAGSVLQGGQEVWVRREETQIRANLIHQLASNFRHSIQLKSQSDNALREYAKQRIKAILMQCKVPYPEALLKPAPVLPIDSRLYGRYPYEPTHFSFKMPAPAAYRFGTAPKPETVDLSPPNPWHLSLMKSAIVLTGFVGGVMGQLALTFMNQTAKLPKVTHLTSNAKISFLRVFNIRDIEALFLTEKGLRLWTVLGLTAIAKVGKMLVDGYREIEVTRQNAHTELRYQTYNWLSLDPAFHKISETEALEDALKKLREAIPAEYHNRKALENRIQTILTNIGRNSAPKYFQMTPAVNLVAARG